MHQHEIIGLSKVQGASSERLACIPGAPARGRTALGSVKPP